MGGPEDERLWAAVFSSEEGATCKQELELVRSGSDQVKLPEELTKESSEDAAKKESKDQSDLFARIRDMSIPQKIKLAMFGNKVARGLLIRDRNKQVPLFVLQNPRLGEEEVVEFAKNTNLDELVFRAIANNTTWMKSYHIKLNLVSNPRVPIDISLRWVKYLHDGELRILAKSKNIPQVIASQCRKLLEKRKN